MTFSPRHATPLGGTYAHAFSRRLSRPAFGAPARALASEAGQPSPGPVSPAAPSPACLLCGRALAGPGTTTSGRRLSHYSHCPACDVLIRSGGDQLGEGHYEVAYGAPGEAVGYGEYDRPAWHRWDDVQVDALCRRGLLAPTGRLLDIGCGWGHLIKVVRARGIEADGFEVSQTAAEALNLAGLGGGRVEAQP